MTGIDDIIAASKAAAPRIVLSEGEDVRVAQAAARAQADGLAEVIIVGDASKIAALEVDGLDRVEIADPATSERLEDYSAAYHELRKHKGVDAAAARKAMQSPLGFAAMMVRQGDADGTIGGAVATTGETVRTALQIVGMAPDSKIVSSFFLMLLAAPYHRPVVFADCGLVIEPNAAELAEIAIASSTSFTALTGQTPRAAMLSFSTKGSAKAPSIDRTIEALEMVRAKAPSLAIDGELQFDAAFVPDVAARKAPGSPIEGAANVFIFPNLDAGNIGYKIAQRLGGATALGPILQGLAKPANDLSRGCSADDVYQMIAVTGAQAAAQQG
ncbi:MAG: phosphate acetyltransferase [Paracoccaceae bacterium]|nr:phosphate acetyltransferase [Paracoccaceae bacterium]MDG1369355.1 phosphate acetyltransferase [Paracoccaceae bacterium]